MDKNHDTIHFLDVKLTKIEGLLQTTVFRKPTDKNTILAMDSFHPPLKHNLPFSRLCRLKRNRSTTDEFDEQTKLLVQCFQSRGYPENWVNSALEKINKLDRSDLLCTSKSKHKQIKFSVNCILTYNENHSK